MRKNRIFSCIVTVLFLFSFAALPVWAGGKQEKEEQTSSEVEQQSSSAEQEQEQGNEATPIEGGKVSTDGEVAAVVNGEKISMSRLEQQVQNYQQQMMQQGQQVQGMDRGELRRQALESIINTEVLYQVAVEEGYNAPEDKVNSEIDSIKERFGGEQELQTMLKQQGMSEEELRNNIARYYTIQNYIDDRFAPEVSVKDEEAKAFYDENTASFKQEEQVRASHILIEAKEDASEQKKQEAEETLVEVQQKLDEGAEFSEMARQYSEGPSSEKGGDLGFITRGQMVKSFEEKAFAMEKGAVSDIVETRFGYHLIKVTDKKEEKTVPYEDVKERIVQYLEEQKMSQNIDAFLKEKKQEMDIERTALQNSQ